MRVSIYWCEKHKLYGTDLECDQNGMGERGCVMVQRAVEANRERLCEYPEFADPACDSGHPNAKPIEARQPRKHAACGWRLVIDLPPLDTDTRVSAEDGA